MTNYKLDKIYNDLMKNKNIFDDKLIGAGGGGFFLIVVKNKKKIINQIIKNNLNFINLKFENDGSKIIET